MKTECSGCGQTYRIDDNQLKRLGRPTLPCPNCGQAILLGESAKPSGETLKIEILNEVKALPPMPQVLVRAQAVVADPMKGTEDLAAVLETDQAMTARVLKVANSAFYGLRNPVTSVKTASVILGESTLMTLITMVSSSRLMGKRLDGYGFDSKAMFNHSLEVAFMCKALAATYLKSFRDDAFVAGLLHDIGKLILDPYVARDADSFTTAMVISQGDGALAEQRIFGFDHADIGADYCQKYNIPPSQVDAIRYHHHPEAAHNTAAAHILHAADHLAHAAPDAESVVVDCLGQTYLDAVGMTPAQALALWDAAAESTAQVMDSLN